VSVYLTGSCQRAQLISKVCLAKYAKNKIGMVFERTCPIFVLSICDPLCENTATSKKSISVFFFRFWPIEPSSLRDEKYPKKNDFGCKPCFHIEQVTYTMSFRKLSYRFPTVLYCLLRLVFNKLKCCFHPASCCFSKYR